MSEHQLHKVIRQTEFCLKCGGSARSLTTHCSGIHLTKHAQFAVIDGELNYQDGEWTGTTQALMHLEQQLFQKGYLYFPDNNHTSQITPDVTSLRLDEMGFIELDDEDSL